MAGHRGSLARRALALALLLGCCVALAGANDDPHAAEGAAAGALAVGEHAGNSTANSTEHAANATEHAMNASYGVEGEGPEGASLEEIHMEETESENEVEAHHAMIFFVIAVLLSVAVLHALTNPWLKALQHTVVLFIVGLLYSVAQRGIAMNYPNSLGVIGETNSMWLSIDPHLILWSMLPILIAGDGMSADTTVSRNVAVQCIWLAGPGVLFIAIVTAYFVAWFIPVWSFKLAFTLGSILAATDPVAVLSLLKELGASTVLSQQISGESLLNDGTAIVLFTMAYAMLEGETFDTHDVIIFLTKMALFAVGFGWVVGSIFCWWIHTAENRFNEMSGTIQIVLTICCAYISFIGAELLGMSGVLSTVAASLVLADQMWPSIVDKEGLHHVWHLLEFLANTVIFFLAGALTGNAMFEIVVQDVINLIVIYLASHVIRAAMVYGSIPILKQVHPLKEPVSFADATVMVWGGLRGAVGLALAFQVHLEMGHGAITVYEGNQVMFYISGMAFLTLIFNATTCPALVKFLRITQPSATTRKMLLWFHGRLMEQAAEHEQECCAAGAEIMHWVLDDVKHHVEKMPTRDDEDKVHSDNTLKSCFRSLLAQKPKAVQCARPSELKEDFKAALQEYKAVSHILKERMPKLPESTFANKRKLLVGLADPLNSRGQTWADNSPPADKFGKSKVGSGHDDELDEDLPNIGMRPMSFDPLLMVSARNAFMELVRANYWEQINDGFFGQHGGGRAEALLHSVEGTIASNEGKLNDLTFLQQELEPMSGTPDEAASPPPHTTSGLANGARSLAKSQRFQTFVSASIMVSVIIDIVYDSMKPNSESLRPMWLGVSIGLLAIFLLEQSVRLFAYKTAYFKKASNVFDALLVLLTTIGIILELSGMKNWVFAADFWVFRLIRVFRLIVPTRVADAIQFWQQIKKKFSGKGFSEEQAICMEHILMYTAFCKAHVHAQHEFVEFFGRKHMPLPGEQACVILESHTLVYKASVATLKAAASLDQEALDDINILREGSNAVKTMRKLISQAQEQNMISSSAAETLMEPMVHKQREWINHIHGVELGTNSPGDKNLPVRRTPSPAMDRSERYRMEEEEEEAPRTGAKGSVAPKATWASCLKFWA